MRSAGESGLTLEKLKRTPDETYLKNSLVFVTAEYPRRMRNLANRDRCALATRDPCERIGLL